MFIPEVILSETRDSRNSFKNDLVIASNNQQRRDGEDNDDSDDDYPETASARKKRRYNKSQKKTLEVSSSNFLADFRPEYSAREQRKLSRKTTTGPPEKGGPKKFKSNSLYDSKGIYRITGEDLCDCLNFACPGCHFPCPNCDNEKCGSTCRCSRKWIYEQIEHDAKDKCITNRYARHKGFYFK